MKVNEIGIDYTKKCKCGYSNHIHPEIQTDIKTGKDLLYYYCGECGTSYPINEAVEVK